MNSYAIDLSGGFVGWPLADMPNLRKAIGYAVLFGKNVAFNPLFLSQDIAGAGSELQAPKNPANVDVPKNSPLCGQLTFDLDFALSNIGSFFDTVINGHILATQLVYDTNCQSVKEFVDKPYPIKGYIAIVSDEAGDPTKDLDGFTSFKFFSKDTGQVQRIFIGICNNSQTDFYTPFAGLGATFIDPQSITKG